MVVTRENVRLPRQTMLSRFRTKKHERKKYERVKDDKSTPKVLPNVAYKSSNHSILGVIWRLLRAERLSRHYEHAYTQTTEEVDHADDLHHGVKILVQLFMCLEYDTACRTPKRLCEPRHGIWRALSTMYQQVYTSRKSLMSIATFNHQLRHVCHNAESELGTVLFDQLQRYLPYLETYLNHGPQAASDQMLKLQDGRTRENMIAHLSLITSMKELRPTYIRASLSKAIQRGLDAIGEDSSTVDKAR